MYNVRTNFNQMLRDYKNNKNLIEIYNDLYDAIISDGFRAFSTMQDFSMGCYLAVQICLQYDDYLNSNNIIQCYKNDTRNKKKDEWFWVYSIKIYGKRTPIYFLIHPEKLDTKLKNISVIENADNILCELCNYYYQELYYVETFNKKLLVEFINRYQNKGFTKFDVYSSSFMDLINGKIDIDEYYPPIEISDNSLLELEIKLEDEKTSNEEREKLNAAISKLVEEKKESNDYTIMTNNPKILIIGA
jgi:hypothetical protein